MRLEHIGIPFHLPYRASLSELTFTREIPLSSLFLPIPFPILYRKEYGCGAFHRQEKPKQFLGATVYRLQCCAPRFSRLNCSGPEILGGSSFVVAYEQRSPEIGWPPVDISKAPTSQRIFFSTVATPLDERRWSSII